MNAATITVLCATFVLAIIKVESAATGSPSEALKSFTSTLSGNTQDLANTGFDGVTKTFEFGGKAIDTTNDVVGGLVKATGNGGQKIFSLGSDLFAVGTEVPSNLFGTLSKGLSSNLLSGGNVLTTTGKSAFGTLSKLPSTVGTVTDNANTVASTTLSETEGAVNKVTTALTE